MTTYKNPPVTEVVAEFNFQPIGWDLAIPGLVYEKIKEDFPVRRMANNAALLLSAISGIMVPGQQLMMPGPGPGPFQRDRIHFVSKDERVIVQIAPNLLVVNNVKMYTEWKDFLPVVKSVFDAYVSVIGNWRIARLALQYVNQMKLPAIEGKVELEDYLKFYPNTGELPPHGPFQMTVQFPSNDVTTPSLDWTQIQLNGIGFAPPEVLNVKMDIKSYTAMPRDFDLDGIYKWMNQAHSDTVRMFEGCITDKSRELFGGTI